MRNRELVIRFLLRGPGALRSRLVGLTVLLLSAGGAGLLVWSAVIHLRLWSDGYRDISVIGPLFLVQGIATIILAVAIVALRRLALLAAGAVAGAATAVGLLLTVHPGLFGFTESLAVPYAKLSLVIEFGAAFVLLAGTVLLALAARRPAAAVTAPVPSGAAASRRAD